MIPFTRFYGLAALLLLLAGLATPPVAAQTSPIAGSAPGPRSVAVTDDAAALLTNPAALCRSVPFGAYFAWDHDEDGAGLGGTGLMATRGFGLGLTVVEPGKSTRLNRLLLGFGGAGRGPVTMGLRGAYEWQRLGYRDATWRWDLGLLWRPAPFFSLGAVAHDLDQAKLHGTPYKRAYTVGIGVRPLPGALKSRLTLFADAGGPEDASWKDDKKIHAGFWAEPLNGVSFGAAVDGPSDHFSRDRTYSIGFRLDALHVSTLADFFFDRKDRRSRTLEAIHFTSARQRTWQRERVLTRTRVSGPLGDESQSGIPLPLIGGPSWGSARPILHELNDARRDPDVRGVLLELSAVSAGALADEIRDEIRRVRDAGKPVVAFTKDLSGRNQLYIASACDQIVLDEMGSAYLLGMRRDILYYGEMLDSAGIRFEKVAHGKYKTAFEPYVLSRPSEGMLEALNSILDDVNEHHLAAIAVERRIDRPKLEDLASGKWWSAEDALAAGLIDSVGDEKVARRILARLAGMKGKPEPQSARNWRYPDYEWATGGKVAVLWLDGAIVDGKSQRGFLSGNTMGSETVVKEIDALSRRRDVKAVVLRIDSGGGSALASDEIWRAVDRLKKKGKKVVSSMSRVAGSGGYYIACNSDRIVAEPTTITGSIGVLMVKPELTGYYDRHRIHVATFQRGDWMGMESTAHALTDAERTMIQSGVDHIYEKFLSRVQAGRGMSRDAVDAVGQGRIWTGRQAKERGLIDELGGLKEAVDLARSLAGLPEDTAIEEIRRPSMWWEAMPGGAARLGILGLLAGRSGAGTGRDSDELFRLENPLLQILAEEP